MAGKIVRSCVAFLIVAGTCLLSPVASAQSNSATTPSKPETIIVTGHRPQQDIDTIVSQFVDLHAATNRKTGQYMRDDIGPVCPITLGLPQVFDDFVTARVVQIATDVGAKTDSSKTCKPNIEIIFTDEPQAVVTSLADRTHGAILGMHFIHETPRLLKITHPIQGWYVTGTRMVDISAAPVTTIDPDGSTEAANTKPRFDNAYRDPPSRVALGTRIPGRRISSIINVLIVADIKEVGGHAIGPVSDYITLLALSEPRSLDQCNELPSILDLTLDCESRAKPDKLTESDIAYLKGLYAADLGATTNSMQKQSIDTGMEDELGAGRAPASTSSKKAR